MTRSPTAGNEATIRPAKAEPASWADADVRPRIPDTELIDQNGNKVRFYSDLVQGKLVLMNAIYTSCPSTCPIQGGVFSKIQAQLGDRVGKDVQIISVSLDPTNDTPERLQAFAKKYDAGPGWTFLTGTQENVTEVLKAMDLYAPKPEEHMPIAAIGNEPTGVWMKALNLASPLELIRKLDYVATRDMKQIARKNLP